MPSPQPTVPSHPSSGGLRFARGGRWALPAFLLLLGLGMVLFFWLPTRIPVPEIYSESYNYGFNNHAAQRIFGAVVGLAFLAAKALRLQLLGGRHAPQTGSELSTRTLWFALGLTLLYALGLYWLTRPAGGIADGSYFIDRIHLMERGQHPYRDFEWVYGSFPLYAAIAIGRLLHLGGADGYNILFVLETSLGVAALWLGLRLCDLRSGGKRAVFLLFALFGASVMAAVSLNYTLLRYALPLLCLTAFPRVDRDPSPRTRLLAALFAVASMCLLLGLWPEEGLAFAAATVAFLPLRRWALGRPFLLDTVLVAACFAAAVKYADHAGLFTTLKTFGAGAFNLPLWPDPPMLLLWAAILALGAFLATGRLRQHLPTNVAYIALYSVGILPGVLGRADPVHIVGYELSLLSVVLLLLWRWPLAWRAGVTACALVFIVLPQYYALDGGGALYGKVFLMHLYKDGHPTGPVAQRVESLIAHRAATALGPQAAAAKIAVIRKASGGGAAYDPRVVFPQSSPIVFAPFSYRPNKLSVYQSPSIDEGYYFGEASITSVPNAERKLDGLRAHPERDLIVATEGFNECGIFIMPREMMRRILLYPFVPPVQHGVTIFTPICRFIQGNYHWVQTPSPQTFGYGLMRHN